MTSTFFHPAARSWISGASFDDDPLAFHRTLLGYAPTPLRPMPALARELGLGQVYVKDESDRLGLPAFKVLGASYAVHRAVTAHGRPTALVTATDGNHGRALARTGRLLDLRVFLPAGVHPAAIAAIENEGAEVVGTGGDYDAAVALARGDADVSGALLVQDTAWPGYEEIPAWIVQGYTTLFGEVDEQLDSLGRRPDVVLVPVGVGSLAEAALHHYRRPIGRHRPALISVEPHTAACVQTSLSSDRLTSVSTGDTIMAGLNCGTPSTTAWPALRGGLDAATSITDDDSAAAAEVLRTAGIDAGPCGAATLAGLRALLCGPDEPAARNLLGLNASATVVLLCTEGSAANPALLPTTNHRAGERSR
jgi:diaminopropionate ammonia-lyase